MESFVLHDTEQNKCSAALKHDSNTDAVWTEGGIKKNKKDDED